MEQRRRHERFSTDIPCRIYIPGEKGEARFEAFARLRDLSLGGVFVESAFRFKGEPDVFVELTLPDGALPVAGRIARQPDGGFGIAFSELSLTEQQRLLTHFIPDDHRRFHKDVIRVALPGVGVEQVSLLLHLWEDWKLGRVPSEAVGSNTTTNPAPATQARSASPAPAPAPAPRPAPPKAKPPAAAAKPAAKPAPAKAQTKAKGKSKR